ncbi:hypothetical protein PENTCL1PPCAC_11420 [Pristionchus entomophagus]|uniref:RNA helicase n=1 Tax=Pristionchus entomophagus TaxID=358040 RepID=A0AAV5T2E3_9BILA|nr:hypothetical protein PENTCL1PPCAC_11420 [Pristionchus entomophagus]
MAVEEYLPLHKDGEINPDLMSFSKLYVDEIIQKISETYSHSPINKFLEALDATDVEMTKDDVEWLVYALLRSKNGFKELYEFLSEYHPSLLSQMSLRNESGLSKEVVDAFKTFFLKPANDIVMERLNEVVNDIEIDSDVENDEEYRSHDYSKKDETVEDKDMTPDRGMTPESEKSLPEENKAVAEETVAKVVEDEMPYGYVETVLDKIAAVFDPEFAISSLERAYPQLKEVKDPLDTPKNAATMNYAPWARAILRQLPRLPLKDKDDDPKYPTMVFDFAHACENDPNNRVALMYLLPDYQNDLDARNAAYRARAHKGAFKMDMVTEIMKTCRPPDDYAKQRRGQIREYQTTVMPITLREYQKELVGKANMGDNTVVVAPTGSGKTVVAAQIMRHHVMTRKAMKKPYRMVMVVPKIPLVEQQQKQLYQYMSDVVYSTVLHGDMMFEEQNKMEKLLCAELIVMTPQILINLLESMRAKERLFVSDMTLLILDECHHCCSNHPYAQLMSIIRACQYDKPQIVGLTASLGVGKSGSLDANSAHEHVVGLLSRMTATSISTVNIYEKELQSHVQLPVDAIIEVKRAENSSMLFTSKIRDYMNGINKVIRVHLQAMSKPGNDSGALIPLSLVKTAVDYNETEKYGGRIEAIKQAIRMMTSGSLKAELNMALDILKVCIMAWGMNDLLPSSKVWPMMKVEMNHLRVRNKDNRFVKEFDNNYMEALERFKEEEDDSEMLTKLRKELEEQFKKNGSSKVIIFVGTRELSQCLSEYINDRRDILRLGDGRECGFIISSKARGVGTVSQTPEYQKAALKKFRDNKLAVLVSTTVAEEGLDVPECNLIIKYNMTGNVISLTQQRGRARAKDSRSVLIALSGSVKKRELENANAEKMMNHVVKKINAEGEAKLKDAIKKMMAWMKQVEERDEAEAKKKEQALQSKSFLVSCVGCGQPLCDSGYIKNGLSHYFVCYEDIWKVVDIDYADTKGKFIDQVTTVVGKVKCKGAEGSCGADLGKVVRYQSCYLPALKCMSLQLKDKRTHQDVELSSSKNKNWNEVRETHFFISKINEIDLNRMMKALCEQNEEIFLLLESRCQEIQKKTKRDALRKYEDNKGQDERGAESD